MINADDFIACLKENNISFVAGVPDSVLKDFSFAVSETEGMKHVTAANEGGAIGLAIGHYLASGKPALVYMQNSGIGNALNPLISLADSDVYGIPMILLVGWRGKPNSDDEPQHVKQGKITIDLLEVAGIKTFILEKDFEKSKHIFKEALSYSVSHGQTVALIAEKGLFEKRVQKSGNFDLKYLLEISREEAIDKVLDYLSSDDVIVSTTGMISRELYESRERRKEIHDKDFLCVGGMGHASQVAAGIALEKVDKKIICLEGDGAFIMHSGNSAISATLNIPNFIHIILNNGSHDSVGGQNTVAFNINVALVAESFGYKNVFKVSSMKDFENALKNVFNSEGPSFIEVDVLKGARKDLGRPPRDMHLARDIFMKSLK